MPKDWIREYIYLALHPWKQWLAVVQLVRRNAKRAADCAETTKEG